MPVLGLTAALALVAALAGAAVGCSERDLPAPRAAADGMPAATGTPGPGVVRDLQADWFAEFPDAGSQFRFTHLVQTYFLRRGQRTELTSDGDLRVSSSGAIHELAPLARTLADLAPELWEQAIAAHFGSIDATIARIDELAPPDWETARPRLRVRLLATDFLTAAGFDATTVLMREDLPGLATCVMIDAERSATLVARGDPDAWSRPAASVFAAAIANTRGELEGGLQIVTADAPGIGTLRTLTGESFYAASAVLWLDAWPDLVGEHGAFVVVPWWGAVFAWPFADRADRRVVPGLHAIATAMTAADGEALSDAVYWRRPDGSFGRIAIARDPSGRLEITPPADLAALLRDG